MQVSASVGRRCSSCQVVSRKGTVFIICKKNKKHNQRQG